MPARSKAALEAVGAGVCFSLPDLVSLASGWPLEILRFQVSGTPGF